MTSLTHLSNENIKERRIPSLQSYAAKHSFLVGLLIRLFLAWSLPLLLDKGGVLPGVAYTDIDFHVFSDAADHVRRGESPYQRHTYRYTPFLAALLALLPSRQSGRYLFCFADAVCGWIIVQLRQQNRRKKQIDKKNDNSQSALNENSNDVNTELNLFSDEFKDALWWLYNPFPTNICTRGSAESFVVLLPVLITVWTVSSFHKSLLSAFAAGFWHGIAVHAKLYPIIYSLSLATSFAPLQSPDHATTGTTTSTTTAGNPVTRFFSYMSLWMKRLLTPVPLVFAVSFLITFSTLTYLSVFWYGPLALQEGLLYHFSRVDHRHNYSIHWYWIYLARAVQVAGTAGIRWYNMAWIGRLLLVPQLILSVYTSLGMAPANLSLALFVQTFLFVTHNKVITAQYFTWYLCLLPLCSDCFSLSRRVVKALIVMLTSVIVWLLSAYCLEMQGMAMHRVVWVASLLFFCANVNLLGALLDSMTNAQSKRKND